MDPVYGFSLALFSAYLIIPWAYRATVGRWAVSVWKRTGFTVEYGPVEVRCYGSMPGQLYYGDGYGHYGAIAILNTRLAFATRRYENLLVPFEAVRWIGTIQARITRGWTHPVVELLIIHCVQGKQWHVYAFELENTSHLAQELSRRCKLDIIEMGRQRESYGPGDATRIEQDIFGQWHRDRKGLLYLAPDRLLFTSLEQEPTTPVWLRQIRDVSALIKDSVLHELNPFSEDLLRIEYQSAPNEKPQVVGFFVHNAEAWAAAIQRRGVKNVSVHTGRKKKAGEEADEAVADFAD